jgi:hypothetical protein
MRGAEVLATWKRAIPAFGYRWKGPFGGRSGLFSLLLQ